MYHHILEHIGWHQFELKKKSMYFKWPKFQCMKSGSIAIMWHWVIQSEEIIVFWSAYKTELPGGNWWYCPQCYTDCYERCQWTYLTFDHEYHVILHRCRHECPLFHVNQLSHVSAYQLLNRVGHSTMCRKNIKIFPCMVQGGTLTPVQVGENWLLKCCASNYVHTHQEHF